MSTGVPLFLTPLTRGAINETLPCYGGMYAGAGSDTGVQSFVEQSDFILHLGPLDTDVTTFWNTACLPEATTIKVTPDYTKFRGTTYTGLPLRDVTKRFINQINPIRLNALPWKRSQEHAASPVSSGSNITHAGLWPVLNKFFRQDDTLIADTGTASFGLLKSKLPPRTTVICASVWASIGYALPAAQGAGLAARECGREGRTIVLQGDGSFQLTCQELSTMIKENLSIMMYVLGASQRRSARHRS